MDRTKRRFLPEGTRLRLGETDYIAGAVVGYGSNAVVYRGKYEDNLQKGYFHQVLIKELFPAVDSGGIYREANGEQIVVEDYAEDAFKIHCQSFLKGNEIQLKLLETTMQLASGNLNSYMKNGTYYTILPWEGGTSLEELIKDSRVIELPDLVRVMEKLLDALSLFHRKGFLHLDISPDNILFLPSQEDGGIGPIQLIDYNTSWEKGERQAEAQVWCWGKKEGYSSPEVALGKIRAIGEPSDLYSACAVFFAILVKRALTPDEIQSIRMMRQSAEKADALAGQPSTVIYQVVKILQKGLRLSPSGRYKSAASMRHDLTELRNRIEGKGITHNALWEASRSQCEKWELNHRNWPRPGLAKRSVRDFRGRLLTSDSFWEEAGVNGRVFLTGEGGIGKTTFLVEYWMAQMQQYDPSLPVVWYLPLYRYHSSPAWKDSKASGSQCGRLGFIVGSLLEYLSPLPEETRLGGDEAGRRLERLFCQTDRITLLLDGLNEAGAMTRELLAEIDSLSQKEGVRLVITSRAKTIAAMRLNGFYQYELLRLTSGQVHTLLSEKLVSFPKEPGTAKLIENPLMLEFYIGAFGETTDWHPEEWAGEETAVCVDAAAQTDAVSLAARYLTRLLETAIADLPGEEGMRLCAAFALEHVLSQAALAMLSSGRRTISRERLCKVTEKGYCLLRKKPFLLAFPAYFGKTRKMFDGIEDDREWFDLIVEEWLVNRFCLLVKEGMEDYVIVHEELLPALAFVGKENKKKLSSKRQKDFFRKGAVVIILALALSSGGAAACFHWAYPVTKQEKARVEAAAGHLITAAGKLDLILADEHFLLEERAPDVMKGLISAESFAEQTEKMIKKDTRLGESLIPMEQLLEVCADARFHFPMDALQQLYDSVNSHGIWMKEKAGRLAVILGADSGYSMDAKEAARNAYLDYITIYEDYMLLQILDLCMDLPDEGRDHILDYLTVSRCFSRAFSHQKLTMEREELKYKKDTLHESLKEAENAMLRRGYP